MNILVKMFKYKKPETHKDATYIGFFNFPCYFDEIESDILPKYWLTEPILNFLIYLDFEFSDGFVVRVKQDKKTEK